MRFCDYGCGQQATHKFKNGKYCCSKYHASCPVLKNKCKRGILKSWTNSRKKDARDRTMKQWENSNTLNSDQTNKKRNASLKNVWSDESLRERNRLKNKKYWNQPHIKEKRRQESKDLFNDLDYIKKYKKGLNASPNKCEKLIFKLINELYPNIYEFTGDFSFWIERLNPDFVFKKEKMIIEFFGTYWHKEEDVDLRNKIFNRNGYKCLYIWESELDDLEQIKKRIIEFHERRLT